jgi:GMP synthase-like glutamine amidotransferase
MAGRFCVINTENSEMWSPVTFFQMFESGLRKDGDVWQVVNIANGESLPDDIKDFQGIVITGSHFNCCDRDTLPWFTPLCHLIQHAAKAGTPKMYGGCFGCQIIAFALGGEVDCNPGSQFALKAENVCLCQPTFSKHLHNGDDATSAHRQSLNIIVSHGQCVVKLPPDSEHIGTSESCVNELFVTGNKKNLLCCQSHPEFLDVNYAMHERIIPIVINERKRLNEEQAAVALKSLQEFTGDDSRLFLSMVSEFLHRQ